MTGPPIVFQTAVADLSDAVDTKLRGFIDQWHPLEGIHGWALDSESPFTSLNLELLVGHTPLCRSQTNRQRGDIDAVLGVRATPGFQFERRVFERLAHLNPKRRNMEVNIRIAGSAVILGGQLPSPTVGELVDLWRQATLKHRREHTPEPNKGDRLLMRLGALREASDAYRDVALRPSAEYEAGQVEAIHISANKLIWFIGWIRRDSPTEFPALIVDRQKYTSGVSLLQYERQDLASRFVGMIGVIDTDWSPPAQIKELFLYFGADARSQLRAASQIQAIGVDPFVAAYRHAQATVLSGEAEALGSILTSETSWVPGNSAATGLLADASLDRLLLIPGFGCLVEGWTINPTKKARTFQLKIGECVLVSDDAATYFKSRPDLRTVYGCRVAAVERAGFVTVLRGGLSQNILGAPMLRVIYDDGTSSVQRIESKLMAKLDCTTDSLEILELFPSIRHEEFYPAMLDALRRWRRDRDLGVRILFGMPCSRVAVIRLPENVSNLRLCFDQIAQLGANIDPTIGICFIAEQRKSLTEAKLLFQELRLNNSLHLSLFQVDDCADGFDALPLVLVQLFTDRFIYIDRGIMLTPQGWIMALKSLTSRGHAIHYFEITDDSRAPDRVNGSLSASCFGWTSAAFLTWLESAPALVRGVRGTNGLPGAMDRKCILSNAAVRVELQQVSKLADMVDDDLLALPVRQVPHDRSI